MRKHIVCFGDSNTHGYCAGYCADPKDCAEGGNRFSEEERWTCLLQKKLGDSALVIEEGLSGRTTVFTDPLHESMAGLDSIYSVLMSHEPVDLLIIMLGTNDTKERFGANAACIGIGMERLILKKHSYQKMRMPEFEKRAPAFFMSVQEYAVMITGSFTASPERIGSSCTRPP